MTFAQYGSFKQIVEKSALSPPWHTNTHEFCSPPTQNVTSLLAQLSEKDSACFTSRGVPDEHHSRDYDSSWRRQKKPHETRCWGCASLFNFQGSFLTLYFEESSPSIHAARLCPAVTHGSPGGPAPALAVRRPRRALLLGVYLSRHLPLQRPHLWMQQRHSAGLPAATDVRAETVSRAASTAKSAGFTPSHVRPCVGATVFFLFFHPHALM